MITKYKHFYAAAILYIFSIPSFADKTIWREVAVDLIAPYSIMLVNDKTYVSTVPDILQINEETGNKKAVTQLAEGSPSGLLLDSRKKIVAIENGTGSLLKFNNDFSQSTVLAEGFNDAVTVKEYKKWYLISDYNFGEPGGQFIAVPKSNLKNRKSVVLAEIDGLGSFFVDEPNDDVYIVNFDHGELVKLKINSWKPKTIAMDLGNPLDVVPLGDDGFIVSDFGGFDGNAGRLLHVGKNGRVTVLEDEVLGNPAGLLVHGGALYVTDLIGGRLLKGNLQSLLAKTDW